MIPLYSLYTPSHRVLKERFFEPSVPNDVELRLHHLENDGDGFICSPSFVRAIVRKVEVILQAIQENWGTVFIWSDVDAQFFAPISEWVIQATRDRDLVFQVDAPGPVLCAGFFFCRGNEDTLRLWQEALDFVRQPDSVGDDQHYVRQTLWNGRRMRWGHLPPVFMGGGTFTAEQWEPGREFPIPEAVVMHHANFTCGVPNKVRQCEYVLEKISRRELMPLHEAYQRAGGREHFALDVLAPSEA